MRNLIIAIAFMILNYPLRASEPDSIWNQGIDNFRQENFHGAINNMNEYLKLKPGNSIAFYNRGLARIKLGDIDKACLDLLKAKAAGYSKKTKFIRYYCDPAYMLKFLKKYYYKKEV